MTIEKERELKREEIMRQLEELEVVEQCNFCGDEFTLSNKPEHIENQGKIVRQTTYWGFGSELDGQLFDMCICQCCFQKLVRNLKIPPEIQDTFGTSEELAKAYERMESGHEEF